MDISLLSQAVGTSTDPLENAQEQIKEAETFFNQMINAFVGYLPTLIAAAIILVVGMVISKLVLKMMSRGMKHDVIDKTVSRFIYSLVRILLYALLATIVLAVLGVPMTSIIAVIGTAGCHRTCASGQPFKYSGRIQHNAHKAVQDRRLYQGR